MVQLTRGDDSLVVAPEYGGAIVGWTRGGAHLFRRPTPEAVLLGRPGGMGCFPLVPFCNRIAKARFAVAGQAHELAANFGDHIHAIHGSGWQMAWRLDQVSADRATLSLGHDPSGHPDGTWPFAFAASLAYQLTD